MRHQHESGRPTRRGPQYETPEGDRYTARFSHFADHFADHLAGHAGGEGRGARGGGGGRYRGGRSRRGDVRYAILALLEERPMHGYEMMQELAERTQGLWRPSPGSLYPALQLLEDQGFVRSESAEGRRQYTLTDEGRAHLKEHAKSAPWENMVRDADQGDIALRS